MLLVTKPQQKKKKHYSFDAEKVHEEYVKIKNCNIVTYIYIYIYIYTSSAPVVLQSIWRIFFRVRFPFYAWYEQRKHFCAHHSRWVNDDFLHDVWAVFKTLVGWWLVRGLYFSPQKKMDFEHCSLRQIKSCWRTYQVPKFHITLALCWWYRLEHGSPDCFFPSKWRGMTVHGQY